MSAPKLTPIPFLALGFVLQVLPAAAQTNPTAPVQSFPIANVEVSIGDDRKMQSDRLFINARQCLGPKYGTVDTSGGDTGDGDADTLDGGDGTDGSGDAAMPDAGADAAVDDGTEGGAKSALVTKALTDESTKITVVLSNLASTEARGATFLEFWMGMQGQDCTQPAQRMSPAVNVGTPPCKKVAQTVTNIDTKRQVLTFSAQELFTDPYQYDPNNPDTLCNMQGVWTLYIVPLANETPQTGMPSAQLGNVTYFVRFEPDFTPLSAVTSVRGGRGETSVNVTWDMASGANQLTDYKVFFDPGSKQPSGAGPCTSELLVPGKLLPADPSSLTERTTKGLSLDVNPGSLNLAINERIATAVVSVDQAGNESAVSDVVCVERISTTGFWDSCGMNEECKDSFNTCSVKLGESGRASWFGWSLGALGIALWLRRGAARARARAQGRRTV